MSWHLKRLAPGVQPVSLATRLKSGRRLGDDAVPTATLRLPRQFLDAAFAVQDHRASALGVVRRPVKGVGARVTAVCKGEPGADNLRRQRIGRP